MRCAAISRPLPAAPKASVHLLANTSGLSEHLPKALAAFLADTSRHQRRRRGARKHRYRRRRSRPAPPISALPPNTRCRTFRAISVQRRPPGAGGAAARRFGAAGARSIFSEVTGPRLRRADRVDARCKPISPDMPRGSACAALSRAVAGFRCDLPDGGGRCRHCGGAGSRGAGAARDRCRSVMIRIRDPWANRRLVICARSFKTLPRPAQATGRASAQGGAVNPSCRPCAGHPRLVCRSEDVDGRDI